VPTGEKCDRWRWFAIYPGEDEAGADLAVLLRQVARREGYRTVQAEHGDGPTTLMVGSMGPVAGTQMSELDRPRRCPRKCIEVDE
jgi:hypothetical protein